MIEAAAERSGRKKEEVRAGLMQLLWPDSSPRVKKVYLSLIERGGNQKINDVELQIDKICEYLGCSYDEILKKD